MVFTWRMVPEVVQPFWAALQRGEFVTGAAEGVGTYRKKGARWMVAEGGVRPRRNSIDRRASSPERQGLGRTAVVSGASELGVGVRSGTRAIAEAQVVTTVSDGRLGIACALFSGVRRHDRVLEPRGLVVACRVNENRATEAARARARPRGATETDRVVRDRRVDERAGTVPDRYRAAAAADSTLAALTALAAEVFDQRAVDQRQHLDRAEHFASPASRAPRAREAGAGRAGPAESTGATTPGPIPRDERPDHSEHYVFDLWAHQWRSRYARGDVVIVRFADDFVVGFEYREDAERFWADLRGRLATFNLELNAEKTRLIEFGRYAARNRKARGLGKPETFRFLGFTHVCGKTRKSGRFKLKRITDSKRVRTKLHVLKDEMRRRMHLPIPEQGRWLASVLRGHYNYYAVPDNIEALNAFRKGIIGHWLKTLRRRSQRNTLTWERMGRLADRWLPQPRILHPWPEQRFAAITQGRSPVR